MDIGIKFNECMHCLLVYIYRYAWADRCIRKKKKHMCLIKCLRFLVILLMIETIKKSAEAAGVPGMKVYLFMSMRTFSTLYVNLWNCLPASVYLNTRETEGVCAVCVFVWSPFPSLLFDRLCQRCPRNDVSTCDISQRQRRTQSSCLSLRLCCCPFLVSLTLMRIDTYPPLCQQRQDRGPNHR